MPQAPWTKLPRRCSDLAASIGLDRYGAWCWLLSRAAYADAPDPSWGTLREGEVAVSTRRLAEAWGVGHHAARAILSDLVEAGLAEVVRTRPVGRGDNAGGRVLRINQGTLSGTLSGTLLNSENKGFATMKKTNHGTLSGTLTGRAPARTILDSRELYRNNSIDRTAYRFSGDYSGVQTAPEILALGQRKEGN